MVGRDFCLGECELISIDSMAQKTIREVVGFNAQGR